MENTHISISNKTRTLTRLWIEFAVIDSGFGNSAKQKPGPTFQRGSRVAVETAIEGRVFVITIGFLPLWFAKSSPSVANPKGLPLMKKGNRPSRRLSFDDAIKVWVMYRAGEFQHRIAAFFDVNPGRVNEIVKGKRHYGSGDAYPPMI